MNNNREEIKELIARSLGIEVLDVEENKDLNLDFGLQESEVAQIWEEIQKKYNFTPPDQDKSQARTVGELLDLVEQYATSE